MAARRHNQRFGAIGTLFFYALLLLFIRYAWISRGHVFARAGPVLYTLLFLLVAYSLAAGNAGTGFRYRTHLVTLVVAAVAPARAGAAHRSRAPGARPAIRCGPGICTTARTATDTSVGIEEKVFRFVGCVLLGRLIP